MVLNCNLLIAIDRWYLSSISMVLDICSRQTFIWVVEMWVKHHQPRAQSEAGFEDRVSKFRDRVSNLF